MANDSGGPGGPSLSERDRQYCELCGKMENLLRYSRCHSSFYCSKEHQRQDWKKHKLVAAEAREARKAAPRRDRAVDAAGPRASGGAAKAKAKAKPTADPAAAASPPR
ncbi:unnamed protein product, partial [Rangifer tarandus platyrhynchus]